MRVVVDTNVFISAALKDMSVPAAALRVAAQGRVLLKSRATETQLFAVCARPRLAALISPTAVSWFKDVMVAAQSWLKFPNGLLSAAIRRMTCFWSWRGTARRT